MKIVSVRKLILGEGVPKICVPIVGRDEEEILSSARKIRYSDKLPDLVELRIDWYSFVNDLNKVFNLLKDIRSICGDLPVLFTFRTKKEGGEQTISWEEYSKLLRFAGKSKFVDMIDVEMFSFGKDVKQLILDLQKQNIIVVGSNHDFLKTPKKEEIVNRLIYMHETGADIGKIAVMPQKKEDVLTLLSATLEAFQKEDMCPVITMSMGNMGVISRISGECFGSCITFASVDKASAPGQIALEKLRDILEVFH